MTCRSIYILTAWLLASPLAQAAADHSNSRAGQSDRAAGQSTSSNGSNRSAATHGTSTMTSASGSDQNDALDALSRGEALPLASLIRMVEQQGLGKVVDAKLLSIRGHLIYRLVFLSDGGIARPAYFAADTGEPLGVP